MEQEASAQRAWEVVLAALEDDMISGRIRPGERFTSERELATRLGVGRSSVREALRVLEVLGLIRTATGSGPTAGAFLTGTPGEGMRTLLRLQVAAQGFEVSDVLSTRVVMESSVVADLATQNLGAGSEAHALLDAMDAEDLDANAFLALDAKFHLALAVASGNGVVSTMMDALRVSVESYTRAGAAQIPDWATTAARLRAEHRAIVAAVEAADADVARDLVERHITGYYTEAGLPLQKEESS